MTVRLSSRNRCKIAALSAICIFASHAERAAAEGNELNSKLENAWNAYRHNDYQTAEDSYLDLLKCSKIDNEQESGILQRLAALYYKMDLAPSEIQQRTHLVCDDRRSTYLFQQMILRYGKFDVRSTAARKIAGLSEPEKVDEAVDDSLKKDARPIIRSTTKVDVDVKPARNNGDPVALASVSIVRPAQNYGTLGTVQFSNNPRQIIGQQGGKGKFTHYGPFYARFGDVEFYDVRHELGTTNLIGIGVNAGSKTYRSIWVKGEILDKNGILLHTMSDSAITTIPPGRAFKISMYMTTDSSAQLYKISSVDAHEVTPPPATPGAPSLGTLLRQIRDQTRKK